VAYNSYPDTCYEDGDSQRYKQLVAVAKGAVFVSLVGMLVLGILQRFDVVGPLRWGFDLAVADTTMFVPWMLVIFGMSVPVGFAALLRAKHLVLAMIASAALVVALPVIVGYLTS
jgi:hypothetical protein